MSNLPKPLEVIPTLLVVLAEKGGQMSFDEIKMELSSRMQISPELLQIIRVGKRTEFQYRVSWALTSAKNQGFIERTTSRGWMITPEGLKSVS